LAANTAVRQQGRPAGWARHRGACQRRWRGRAGCKGITWSPWDSQDRLSRPRRETT